ncbi:MAG: M28 family peptidase [Acidobacteria bacterium]|nr:M28 family peptidase [Acidobacteriota bacterium]MBI3655439.1 M28 family peptidase [Acidobacteriota bacterium]
MNRRDAILKIALILLFGSRLTVAMAAQAPRTGVTFKGTEAFKHVEQLVALGPRPSGSQEAQAAQRYILQTLKSFGLKTEEENFTAFTPIGPIKMKNIIAKIPGQKPDVIIVGSHYDTMFTKRFKFVGANDGGSSTGALLELGRVLGKRKNALTYWLVFFDGEEALVEWSATDSLYGSRHFVETRRRQGTLKSIKAMVLLDMIGDKSLNIRRDTNSTRWLVDLFWEAAADLKLSKYFLTREHSVADDHVPFLEAGIPAIDIIDYDYGFSNVYWHTAADTLDKISPDSLQTVGQVVLRGLEKLEAKFK